MRENRRRLRWSADGPRCRRFYLPGMQVTVQEVQEALAWSGASERVPVDVRETHISWVFLAEDRAYKLKKPLVLPFVDYGTPQRRHEMCSEEIRLNRPLAPDLYIGIRSLVPGRERLLVAAENDPNAVDYLVEMRRYDEATTMASKLGRGELTHGEVRDVGRMLARFHAQAPPVRPRGIGVLAVERRWTKNFHELLAVEKQRAEIERTLALERFMHAFVVGHAGLLDRRARSGLVREVHGDLRAEHVLLTTPIQVIDCIEFDSALRELDVSDDLAFLVMDLTAHGGISLARALVQSYRDAGGDCGTDQLVAFYAAYRALVRAKVAMLRAEQHSSASAERGRESAAARDLLDLAETFAWRARLPLVIVVCGLPAAGKSYLARTLAQTSRLPHLSSDLTRKRLAGVRPTARAPDAFYEGDFSRLTYGELGRRAAAATASRGGAIVDATFRHRPDRDAFFESLAQAAPVLFVECRAPARVLRERARERMRDVSVSDASSAVVERELSSWEPLDEVPAQAHVTVRTDQSLEREIRQLLAWLDTRA